MLWRCAIRTKEAADRLGVSTATIRLWSAAKNGPYTEFLTDMAKGGGHQRELTDFDVRLLWQVRLLSDAGHTQEEIRGILAKMRDGGYSNLPDLPSSPEEGRALTVSVDAVQAALERQKGAYETRVMVLTTERDHLADALALAQQDRAASEQQRAALQADYNRVSVELGELRGELRTYEARLTDAHDNRRTYARIALVLVIVALVLLAAVVLLALQTGGAV